MQFNTQRGQGAASYLQGSMFPTMVDGSKYWSADPTISAHSQAQGLIDRTEIKSMGDTYAQMAVNDALVYEADKVGQTGYNTKMGQVQTRFAGDIMGGALDFATGMASLGGGGGGGNNYMNNPNINYDSIWNGSPIGF